MAGIAKAKTAWQGSKAAKQQYEFPKLHEMDGFVFRSRARRSRIADSWLGRGAGRARSRNAASTLHVRDRAAQGFARDPDGLAREIMLEAMFLEGVWGRAVVFAEVLFWW
jgi:hypothetical protein